MSLIATALRFGVVRFPRVSGDEPPTFATVIDSQLFSPRERG